MAAYFLDTSALVKRYHPEAGTPVVDQVFSEAGANIVVSRLVMVEIVSAFALKVRSGTIPTSKFRRVSQASSSRCPKQVDSSGSDGGAALPTSR